MSTSEGLWDYDNGDDGELLDSEGEKIWPGLHCTDDIDIARFPPLFYLFCADEVEGGNKKRDGSFDPTVLLLSPNKRLKVRKRYGETIVLDIDSDKDEAPPTEPAAPLSDSDLELLEEEDAEAAAKEANKPSTARSVPSATKISKANWENRQLLAGIRARLRQAKATRASEDSSSSGDVGSEEASPLQLRRAQPAAAARPEPSAEGPASPGDPQRAAGGNEEPGVIIVTVVDRHGNVVDARIKETDPLKKLINAFQKKAVHSVSIADWKRRVLCSLALPDWWKGVHVLT